MILNNLSLVSYSDTPIQELTNEAFTKAGIRLLIKREDLNHPLVSGNKWWKLKYNLEEAKNLGKKKLLTFGGAYSNHIFAAASAAKEAGFESVGIIRGEETLPLNPTLTFAKMQGMHLHYISRETYRTKNESEFIQLLHEIFGDFYLIPEGGTNGFAVKGCEEWGRKLLQQTPFDVLCLPVGTGGTMAGLVIGLKGEKEVLGVSVLKGGDFLKAEIEQLINDHSGEHHDNWSLLTSYHHGGYAKSTMELLNFIDELREQLPLDPIYSSKMMWAIFEEVKNKRFKKGMTILALHTGGLQLDVNHPNRS